MKKIRPAYAVMERLSNGATVEEGVLLDKVDNLVRAIMCTGLVDGELGFVDEKEALAYVEEHTKKAWAYYESFTEEEFADMLKLDILAKRFAVMADN